MESVLTEETISNSAHITADTDRSAAASPGPEELREMTFTLGVWVAGLQSFLSGGGKTFIAPHGAEKSDDHIRELRLARAALQRCSFLTFSIMSGAGRDLRSIADTRISTEDLREFASALREPLLLADSLDRTNYLKLSEWQAWCRMLLDRFGEVPMFTRLVELSESDGEAHLPKLIYEITKKLPEKRRAEIDSILPRFGRILRHLEIVGDMLERDEPLKPALLIFAKVGEMTQELISHLDHHVQRAPDREEEFMASLDRASYTATIELKRVLKQELSGLTAIRPASTVYARVEAAHALLSESFQAIITGFAKMVDPSVDAFRLFPNFGSKLKRSISLRQQLHKVLVLSKAAESSPDKKNVKALNEALTAFMDDGLNYVFFKDTEAVERFVEEILVTHQGSDLVPILHRFAAYIETLFAQVCMRAVLENHPFDPNEN